MHVYLGDLANLIHKLAVPGSNYHLTRLIALEIGIRIINEFVIAVSCKLFEDIGVQKRTLLIIYLSVVCLSNGTEVKVIGNIMFLL